MVWGKNIQDWSSIRKFIRLYSRCHVLPNSNWQSFYEHLPQGRWIMVCNSEFVKNSRRELKWPRKVRQKLRLKNVQAAERACCLWIELLPVKRTVKNIKFSQPTAHGYWLLFMQPEIADAFPTASILNCVAPVWCCNKRIWSSIIWTSSYLLVNRLP